jgi:hypothetical protein
VPDLPCGHDASASLEVVVAVKILYGHELVSEAAAGPLEAGILEVIAFCFGE